MQFEEVDFVIAGGGSAGCVLANRLSEDPGSTVILLEAGGTASGFLNRMPVGAFTFQGRPPRDWCLVTEPDPSMNGRSFDWTAGRMLGGGSAINGAIYIRGAKSDYDGYAAAGCASWAWDDVLPYFLKSEGFTGAPNQSHSTFGPLGVSVPRMQHPLAQAFVEACRETGLRRVEDYCGGDIDGAFLNYVTHRGGQRSSTARAFLEPVMHRPNLKVITDAHVDRVLITDGKASGVRFLQEGEPQTLHCKREVIVSCGTLQSPAVLLRSGIGPALHLQAHGIEVVVDAPQVGQNLQEHASFPSSCVVSTPTYNSLMKPLSLVGEFLKYLAFHNGLMTIAPVEAMAYLRSQPDLAEPDIKLSFGAMCFDPDTRKPYAKPGIVVFANVAKPQSRGEIRLRSNAPLDKPVIDHRLLGEPADMTALIAGVKQVQQIFKAPALARHVVSPLMPRQAPQSDAEWADLLRAGCGIGYHPVGTCRMGGDAASVVDPKLRVRGVRGLRVADAAVLPIMPAANTNAPAIMVGEKAADMIRADSV